MPILRQQLNSHHIDEAAYNEETSLLEITFATNGETYQYYHVKSEDYQGLVNSPSPGGYFHAHIKNSYAWRKVAKDASP